MHPVLEQTKRFIAELREFQNLLPHEARQFLRLVVGGVVAFLALHAVTWLAGEDVHPFVRFAMASLKIGAVVITAWLLTIQSLAKRRILDPWLATWSRRLVSGFIFFCMLVVVLVLASEVFRIAVQTVRDAPSMVHPQSVPGVTDNWDRR